MKRLVQAAFAATGLLALASPASASLSLFTQYSGKFGLSTDGGGSTTGSYTVNAYVPLGATVVGAYLYQSNYTFSNTYGPFGVTLDGNAVTFGPAVINGTDCCGLNSARADVTSLVKPVIDVGPGGTYAFSIVELGEAGGQSTDMDGTALVVIYSDPTLPTQTVAILDGFSNVNGDSFTFNSAAALDPGAAGFLAELRLGIGFSCCDQNSSVVVNGTTITTNAGNNDDGFGELSNSQLITVGGDDDPFSAFLASYADDHERYNLASYINTGDTKITVRTQNPSNDDNLFLAAFIVSGEGRVVGPGIPEPATWALMIAGFGMVGASARRRRRRHVVA
jgi:hypothetical protein